MATYYDQNKYNSLREEYEFFRFQRYDYTLKDGNLSAKFYFSLDDKYFFTPTFEIPFRKFYRWNAVNNSQLDTLVFNIGMIELISYWKLACPKKVYISPFNLKEKQILWWKKLYFNGLGEFFYLNGIKENVNDFMEIICESDKFCEKLNVSLSETTLVPVGGGKDSVVTIELLKNKMPIICESDRVEIVSSIKYVDQIILQNDMDKLKVVKEHKINAVFVGSDWKGTPSWDNYEKQFASLGCDVVYLDHTDGISSTILRERLNKR